MWEGLEYDLKEKNEENANEEKLNDANIITNLILVSYGINLNVIKEKSKIKE